MKVTVDEIVKWLRNGDHHDHHLADRIEAHGIEQPSIDALISEIDDWLTNGWDRAILGGNSHPSLPEILDKYRGQK